jgi:TolB protein
VDVLTGETRPLTGQADDAVQPHWSPSGLRIAYWGVRDGSRDIWTVRADGSSAAPVTRDAFLDWNPVWSPDGKHLYFSSNRGGSMNLWRIRIEEDSGRVLGPPEPVTTPAPFSGYISFTGNGHRLAYVQQVRTVNLERITFDPTAGKSVGQAVALTRGLKILWSPAVSSDGRGIAFSTGSPREDIFVMQADGTGTRQLTDDPDSDRMPAWSPDDKRIAFCSTRGGKWEVWVVNVDGSRLERLSHMPGVPVVGPVWSPDGSRLACSRLGGDALILNVGRGWKEQRPEALAPWDERDVFFAPRSWSPDGKMLAGDLRRAQGASSGIVVYSLSDKEYRQIAGIGAWPRWLHDSRRLVFHHQGRIHLIDSESGRVQELYSASPRVQRKPGCVE